MIDHKNYLHRIKISWDIEYNILGRRPQNYMSPAK